MILTPSASFNPLCLPTNNFQTKETDARTTMDSTKILDTSQGWSHLHDLCSATSHPLSKHWDDLLLHISRFKEEASEIDRFGHTPLHLVLRHNPPLSVVSALYEAYQDALCLAEAKTGFLPLHVVCSYGCTVDVLRFLISDCHGRWGPKLGPLITTCVRPSDGSDFNMLQCSEMLCSA